MEFYASPFLVQEWEVKDKNGTKETLRLDLVGKSSEQYKGADILVFNTGHWWTHDKTSKGYRFFLTGFIPDLGFLSHCFFGIWILSLGRIIIKKAAMFTRNSTWMKLSEKH